MKPVFAAASAIMLSACPVLAGETPWQEVAPGARLRVISSDAVTAGVIRVALELELAPGLKTYWRVPGESGVPTTVAAAQKGAPRLSAILWPVPQWDIEAEYVDFVYRDHLVLPVDLTIGDHTADPLTIETTMGICSDVCVPVKAEFELPVGTGKTDFAQDLRIRQAAAETPIAWDRETSPIGDPAIEPATGTLTFTIDPKLIDPGRLFATVEGAGLGFAPPQPIPGKPNGFAMKLLARPGMAAAAATAVRFTFVTARGPYEIVQPL